MREHFCYFWSVLPSNNTDGGTYTGENGKYFICQISLIGLGTFEVALIQQVLDKSLSNKYLTHYQTTNT